MPELPEVETIRRDLAASLIGRKLAKVELLNLKTAKNDAAFFVNALSGRSFENIERYGKLLAFRLNESKASSLNKSKTSQSQNTLVSTDYLLVHLKMTGQLILEGGGKQLAGGHSLSEKSFSAAVGGALPNKHTRAIFIFQKDAGTKTAPCRLFFNDLRKFGYLKIVSEAELKKIVAASYGPEPLAPEFTVLYLTDLLRSRKTNIKALLLNQKLIAGLGNIYVDEALFLAGVRPDKIASSLKLEEIKKLQTAIKRVITQAIAARGTTFSNYVDSSGRKGNFSRLLKVYGRASEPCVQCGKLLVKKKLAGRGTHFCPICQK